MNLHVIIPPEPLLGSEDIPGHNAGDAAIEALIAAAQEEIDGPDGWVGRAFGVQTLEYSGWFPHSRIRLPCPPAIEAVSLVWIDHRDIETSVDITGYSIEDNCLVVPHDASWVSHHVRARIRYRAGYNGIPVEDGGTGDVPKRAEQAIILAVQHLADMGGENLFLRSDEVEGVGTRQYVVSDAASKLIRTTTDRLLSGLRIYR